MTPQAKIVSPCHCGDINCKIAYGTCHCGCKETTPIARMTRTSRGIIKGLPCLYLRSHGLVRPRVDFADAAPFKINGVYCKLVSLTKNLFSIVWAVDYERAKKKNWRAKHDETGYYARNQGKFDPTTKKRKTISMEGFLLGSPEGVRIDHINGNTLDNRRDNLRPSTRIENAQNRKISKNNKCGYKGVSPCDGKYQSNITVNRVRIYLGTFDDPLPAHEAYKVAALKYFGKFARFK